jgi:hypothetical protein
LAEQAIMLRNVDNSQLQGKLAILKKPDRSDFLYAIFYY